MHGFVIGDFLNCIGHCDSNSKRKMTSQMIFLTHDTLGDFVFNHHHLTIIRLDLYNPDAVNISFY